MIELAQKVSRYQVPADLLMEVVARVARYLVPAGLLLGMMSGMGLQDAIAEEKRDSLILKMMIVNPSEKYNQTYPMKGYLPEEVRPEHVLDAESMKVEYDEAQKLYYVSEEVELTPGESVVKTVKLKDVWYIPEKKMKDLSDEANDLYKKLKGTEYEDEGRLLLSNIKVLLLQIYERQNDQTKTPADHIKIYRENKEKVHDVEVDLMAMRRFVITTGGEAELFKSSGQSAAIGVPGMLTTSWDSDVDSSEKTGSVSALLIWKVIFLILLFTGFACLVFLAIWHFQIKVTNNRIQYVSPSSGSKATKEDLKIGDFLDIEHKDEDHAA